jgi:hypothetical protein
MMAGHWVGSRGAQTTFLSAIGLIGQTKVGVGAKGELVVPDLKGLNGQPIKWVETAPFLWQEPNGHDRLSAKVVDGKVERWSFDLVAPFDVYLRASPARDAAWLVPSLCVSLAALLLTVVFWPVNAIVRRRFRARLDLPAPALRAYRAGKLGALLVLSAFLTWALSVTSMFSDLNKTTAAFDPVLRFAQGFGFIAFVGGFLLTLWNLWSVWTGKRRWPAKLWSVVLVFSAFIALWIALVFHLISWGVHY